MQQQVIIVVCLGHPPVGLAQHVIETLLKDFRQPLSVLGRLIVKYLAAVYFFLMIAVLMDAHHQVRPGLVDDIAAPAHIRHLFVAVPGLVESGIRVTGHNHIDIGGFQIRFQLLGDA